MKKSIICLMTALLIAACTEEVDTSARYVFHEDTAIDYMNKLPDSYSTYVDLLFKVPVSKISHTTVGQLLTARGHYTVFAPTNEAIQQYLDTLAATQEFLTAPSWDAFTDSVKLDSIRKVIVQNSIIDSGDLGMPYEVSDFPIINGAELTDPTLNDHRISIYYSDENADSLWVNKDCPISVKNRDIRVMNGMIHQMEKVIAPKDITADIYIQDVIDRQTEGFLVMARAIQACGLMDTLRTFRDDEYELKYQQGLIGDLDCNTAGMGNFIAFSPEHRKVGFTIFAETDSFWREQGLNPSSPDLLQELQQWIESQHLYSDSDAFTTDDNYTNEHNLLNQWITYHILPMRLVSDKLVIHHSEIGYNIRLKGVLGNPVTEYYPCYGKRRLLKLYESKKSDGVRLNRFAKFDNGRRGNGDEIDCEPDKEGIRINRDSPMAEISGIVNACIYPINEPLAYTDEVRDNLKKERIRFDFMACFPEAMTNDIRKKDLSHSNVDNSQFAYIPPRSVYPYFENLWLSDQSNFRYTNFYGVGGCPHLYGDEVLCTGRYEVTLKLHPVPRSGIYELRFGYWADGGRGIAQVYFGDNVDHMAPTGIPINFAIDGNNRISGWEEDTEDDEYNAEIDKRMRHNGFMKEGKSICPLGDVSQSGRYDTHTLRRILVRQYIDAEKDYYLRIKSVLDTETKCFMFDFFEFCPKEVYDNPNEPEDIW